MSITNNIYSGNITINELKKDDYIKLYGSSHSYKIMDVQFCKCQCEANPDTILITFYDNEKAKYCLDGEVSCATKAKYFKNIKSVKRKELKNENVK